MAHTLKDGFATRAFSSRRPTVQTSVTKLLDRSSLQAHPGAMAPGQLRQFAQL